MVERAGGVHLLAWERRRGRAVPSYLPGRSVSWQSGLPLALMDGVPLVPERRAGLRLQLAAKRFLDIALSLVTLVLLAPLLLFVAWRIRRASPGGIFFRQVRQGLYGRPFVVLKFRSMYAERCDVSGVSQTTDDDPRITPLGRALRRWNIDELPQLLNVLKGDMSLVGPRPHVLGMWAGGMRYEELVPYYDARHQFMKPGLSGWAQANGLRGPTDDPQRARGRIDHDLAYIQNFSLWLDIKIMAKTLAREVAGGSGG